jgi:hypothetical protein
LSHYGGEDLFMVEGDLQALQVARTTVNLLAQIEKNLPAKNLAAGVAGVVGGMHGMRCPSNFTFQWVARMPPWIADRHAC